MKADFQKLAGERRAVLAEIAGTCPEHGAYTRGQSRASEGGCPACWERQAALREKELRLARFVEGSGVPRRFQRYVPGDFMPPTPEAEKAALAMRRYAENFPEHRAAGRCVIMAGRTGAGKTMLACAVCRQVALEHGLRCRYATAYHIARDIKDAWGGAGSEREVVRGYVEPDLLVVDEVGVQHGTDAEKLLLFEVLNGRYEAVKPTLVISNLEPGLMGDYLGDRVMDRLRENGGAILIFDWKSHRGGYAPRFMTKPPPAAL